MLLYPRCLESMGVVIMQEPKTHPFVYEILYHFNCYVCNNWWSYAKSPNGKEDPVWTMVGKFMHCPHCSAEARLKVKDGF